MEKTDYKTPAARIVVLQHEHSACQAASTIKQYLGTEIEEGNDPFED